MSLTPDTADLPHEDPAAFLRAAYARLNTRSLQASLAHEAAIAEYDAITQAARMLPLAYGDGKAAQDWLIASLYEVVDEELDQLHARLAWIAAEFDLIHALAIEHGIDLEPPEDAGHG
jgi:hypothetical protein